MIKTNEFSKKILNSTLSSEFNVVEFKSKPLDHNLCTYYLTIEALGTVFYTETLMSEKLGYDVKDIFDNCYDFIEDFKSIDKDQNSEELFYFIFSALWKKHGDDFFKDLSFNGEWSDVEVLLRDYFNSLLSDLSQFNYVDIYTSCLDFKNYLQKTTTQFII